MLIEANTIALAFEKRKGFIATSTGKETGGKAHTCLPNPGVWGGFKGFGETGWYVEVFLGQVFIG